jgi:hypothetical protein
MAAKHANVQRFTRGNTVSCSQVVLTILTISVESNMIAGYLSTTSYRTDHSNDLLNHSNLCRAAHRGIKDDRFQEACLKIGIGRCEAYARRSWRSIYRSVVTHWLPCTASTCKDGGFWCKSPWAIVEWTWLTRSSLLYSATDVPLRQRGTCAAV